MRIAYLGRWSAEPSDAVRAKVEAQARQWRAAGHEVDLIALSPVAYARGRWGLRGVTESLRLRRAVAQRAPDVLYIRLGVFLPTLAALQRRFASVVEVNADDRREAALRGGLARRAATELSRRSLLGRAGGVVCVSRELARRLDGSAAPVRVIANGARVDVAAPASTEPGERPLLVLLVGVPMPWHGLDKVPDLARALPECDVAVAGASPDDLPGPLPANLRVHPPADRSVYGRLLLAADVGIGSLALHRAGLEEASPLKVREYLAHGLPVVVAHEDTDLEGTGAWFVLRLPNAEDNVRAGAEHVRRFVASVRGRRVPLAEVARLVGAPAKERERLAFMAEVVARRRAAGAARDAG